MEERHSAHSQEAGSQEGQKEGIGEGAPFQSEGSSCPQTASLHSYPPEYNPFDRPVGEVVAQLFDDSQPINLPPAKRQR